jgi:hypothetical protein
MSDGSRILRSVLAPVLVAAAIFGYFVGVHHSSAASAAESSAARAHIASGHTVILEYPSTWTVSQRPPPAVRGLPIKDPLTLLPSADPSQAGLVSGQLAVPAQPLPAEFLSTLSTPPKTEVLDLLDVQAYRYSSIKIAGESRAVILYVVPSSEGHSVALVCYAQNIDSPYLAQCSGIVATLSLVGQPAPELRPDGTYATDLNSIIGHLDLQRVELRKRLGGGVSPHGVGTLADRLAGDFDSAQASIAALDAPLAATPTQEALVHGLKRAKDTYSELATAATVGDWPRYELARQNVEAAEDEVNLALEGYGLLGYGTAGG